MYNINQVQLTGKINKVEFKETRSGDDMAIISFYQSKKDKNDDWKTTWFNINAFKKQAELIKKLNLQPKQWAHVECRIDDGSYESQDGQKIKKYDFILKNLTLPPKESENQKLEKKESPFNF